MTNKEAKAILENDLTGHVEGNNSFMDAFWMAVDALSQEPKTGHWIAQDIYNCHTDFKCSECGYIHSFMHLYGKPTADYTYCPYCGARMVEPQEISDRNLKMWEEIYAEEKRRERSE